MRAAASRDVGAAVERLQADLVALRRDLHRHPELGFAENRTASVVADRLGALGLTVRTGVAGIRRMLAFSPLVPGGRPS